MSSPRTGGRANVTAIVVVAVVVVVLVAAGASLVGSPRAPTSDRVGVNASEAVTTLDGVEATRTTVVERGGETSETVVDVALRPGTDLRHEVVVSGDRRYDRRVSNGSVLWLHDADKHAVERVPLTQTPPGESTRGDRIERLFTALNVTMPSSSASATLDAPVTALPVVPRTPSEDAVVTATGARPATVHYNGTTTVAGRDVHVLHVAPGGDAPSAAVEQTVWVDAATFFPLQTRTDWVDDGTPVTVTTTYENVTFDPGVGDDRFVFDPPADASVETVETPDRTVYESVQSLRAAARAPVPDPDLGASFRVTYATETTGWVHGAGVRYANETALVTAAAYNRTFPGNGDRTVAVGDHEGVVDVGPTTSVSWNCDEYRYTVRGEGVPVSFLVEAARSVECGGGQA